jgi:hypothetical protein
MLKTRLSLSFLISVLLLCAVSLYSVPSHKVFAEALPVGASNYLIEEKSGVTEDPVRVYAYRSAGWQPGNVIVFVFHGMKRNAEEYCSGWVSHADEYDLLIICPEFTKEKYPGSRYYHTGNIMNRTDGTGSLQPKDHWVLPAIDRIIGKVITEMGAYASPVVIFGHSAGGQIVHRYALLGGKTDACLIIPANAGLYTMPDKDVPFPYGLGGVPVSDVDLAEAFAKPVVVLLGEEDIKRSSNLRMTPEADRQGLNRLARGKSFFAAAKAKAEALGVPFNWRLVTVPGVGHQGTKMGNAAMNIIWKSILKDEVSL